MSARRAAMPPVDRPGPRPLALHLALAAVSRSLADGLAPASTIRDMVAGGTALGTGGDSDLRAMLDGIQAYRHHPFRRPCGRRPVFWRDGTTRILDCSPRAASAAAGERCPVLLVPSLVNRAYVLDLLPERSLARYLARRGFAPYLVDWGAPGVAESALDLTGYVVDRLGAGLSAVAAAHAMPVALVGYCMGGLLSVAAAQRQPESVAALALLATPWDFHVEQGWLAPLLAMLEPTLEAVLTASGGLPADYIQAGFALLNPTLVPEKFRGFAESVRDDRRTRIFVAVEDWLNDGVPLAAPVARDCLLGWYRDNTPRRGRWSIAGTAVLPESVRAPALVVVPAHDRIVPPGSAAALADLLPDAVRLDPPCGHVGMVVSDQAPSRVWRPLADWLAEAAGPAT